MAGKITENRNCKLPLLKVLIRYHALNGHLQASQLPIEKSVIALLDTGATNVVAKPSIISELGLQFAANISHTVIGQKAKSIPGYACDIVLGSAPANSKTITDVLVLAEELAGYDLILGWDVLRFFDISFAKNGNFTLSF